MLKDNEELKKLYEDDVKEKTDADWSNKEVMRKLIKMTEKERKR